MQNKFYEKLKDSMDKFVHLVYKSAKGFPRDELYGVTSQLRRASLSIVLNFIEGYSRRKKLVMINFMEISYGSLKETKYLLHFSLVEKYLSANEYQKLQQLAEEIGAMLWTIIKNLEKSNA